MTEPPAWASLAVSLEHQRSSTIFLAFTNEDLKRLHAALGNDLSYGFLAHAMLSIVGMKGTLCSSDGKALNLSRAIAHDAKGAPITICYKADDQAADLRTTIIPSSETSRTSPSAVVSTTAATGITPVPAEFTAKDALQAGLSGHAPNGQGVYFDQDYTSRQRADTNQQKMAREVRARDGDQCTYSGRSSFLQAAHLFYEKKPHWNLIHVLATRRGLYQQGSTSLDPDFDTGVFNPRLAFLLWQQLHDDLDNNNIAFYLLPNCTLTNGQANQRKMRAAPLNEDGFSTLDLTLGVDRQPLLGHSAPLSSIKPTQTRLMEPQHIEQPLSCIWDWCFGSRVLAAYGTQAAMKLAAASPMQRAVEDWAAKRDDARAATRKKKHAKLSKGM